HGLNISNNPLVLKMLKPTVAIMSCGTQKGCDPETVTTLKSVSSIQSVFQIHKSLKKTENTPDELIANLEAKCEGNYIKLSTSSDSKSYTVSIPATKVEKTFKTQVR